jgi:2-aminoadipate transaminase
MTFAHRTITLKPDEIREMIKITSQPGFINFAGGLPAAELFPVKEMIEAEKRSLEEEGPVAMQYHSTDGYIPLREKIVKRLAKIGVDVPIDEVLITSGSQQAISLGGEVFVNEGVGDIVLTEIPTYSGAFNALKTFLPDFMGMPTDDEGVIPEKLEEMFKQYGGRIKLIYVIPDYQNPSGRAWSMERRKAFVDLVSKYQVPVLEDAPYRELSFQGEPLPPLKSLDKSGMIIHLGSFSKVLAPGYRIAYIVAQKDILNRFCWASQGAFLQSSTANELAIDRYLAYNDLDAHIQVIRKTYKERCELMVSLMETEFPKSVKFARPQGGMFTWVELPEGKSARELLQKALEAKVAYVVGDGFFPAGNVFNCFRINFASMKPDLITEGMQRLGKAVREYVG